MSQELERVYTINLGKVLLSPNNQRAKRAINMIKEFTQHHMKTDDVKIEEDLAHQIWARGIKHPPRKIRVRMTKTDEGYVLVSPYEEEIESSVKPKEKGKEEKTEKLEKESKVEEITTKVEEKDEDSDKVLTEESKDTEKPKEIQKQKQKGPLSFVDPEKGAKFYIKRYIKEQKYKDWFEKNHPNYTIFEAVGISETEFKKITDEINSEKGQSEKKPKETKADKPKETKADKPKETKADKPKETKADKPKETKADKPKETKADKPKETKADKPKETKADKPKETKEEKPKD